MKPLTSFMSIALILGCSLSASAQFQPWQGSAVLDDPEWRKSFLGSYGFLSGAEPAINATEAELLREILDLMKVNPRAAAEVLQQQAGADRSAALDFVLANLEFQNGRLDQAVGHYEGALQKFPDFRRAHKNLGLLLVQKDECGAALGHLSRAIELGDRDGRSYGLMGYCYLDRGNHLSAEVAYRNAIMHQPHSRDWKLGLARSLLAMQRYREAAALLEDLIAADPENANIWLLQANAYVGLDQPLAAAVNLEAVRMMGVARANSLVLLGDIYMNAGMPVLAKSAYLEAVERDTDGTHFAAAYRAADLLIRTRSYAEAEAVLTSIDQRYADALSEDDDLKVLTLKAKVARAQGREKEAARLLESVVERDGMRGDALLELAAHYREKGDHERALLFIERAQKIEAFEYQALLDHAQLMVSERDYAMAADLLRSALEIKSEPRVEQFLARVEQASRH